MTQNRPPVRWIEGSDRTPQRAVQAYLSAREQLGPPAALHAQLRARVLAAAELAPAPRPQTSHGPRVWLSRVGAAVVLAGAGLWMLSPRSIPAPRPAVVAPVVTKPAAPEPAVVAVSAPPTAAAAPGPSSPTAAGATLGEASDALTPSRDTTAVRALGKRGRQSPALAAEPAASPAEELLLLRRARRSLRREPADSLRLVEEHAARYARGSFAQERELLRIEALMILGRDEEARSAAVAFQQHYPTSAHLERISLLVGAHAP